MDAGSEDLPAQDVGIASANGSSTTRVDSSPTPNWRALGAVGISLALLLGAFAFGRSGTTGEPPSQFADANPIATPPPADPVATATPSPTPVAPVLVDLLGEGTVLAELELGNRSRAILWCRESVPGTQISSTLALIHVATSIQFGDQVVLYEELVKPWLPSRSGRRGPILETEGLGASNSASEPAVTALPTDGESCRACAPERVSFGNEPVLVGTCVHGVPFRASMVYVIAPPVRPGQTPLALHVSCGITTAETTNDELVIAGEAPLVRGLYEARFPLPAISFERTGGRFVASDLELLNWNCDIDRSTHLADSHRLPVGLTRSISYDTVDSAIGEVGVHGPMLLGLTTDQCSQLTRAYWGQTNVEDSGGTPITDLVGIDAPSGRDWFYGCSAS